VSPDVPTIVTYHSDIVKQSRLLPAYRPLLERSLDRADRIITTSPRLRDRSEVLSQFRSEVSVVPLAIDLDRIDCDPPVDSEIPVPDRGQVLLFVGRLNYYKGVEYLIKAFSELSTEATLLLIGDSDRRDSLETLAATLDLDESVRFLGKIPDHVFEYYYDVADFFVLPSVEPSEAFGIVQLKAMAHGTPVINTDLTSGVHRSARTVRPV
jgi:rhamnosyl/mannosyltransferase